MDRETTRRQLTSGQVLLPRKSYRAPATVPLFTSSMEQCCPPRLGVLFASVGSKGEHSVNGYVVGGHGLVVVVVVFKHRRKN
jgi:hypothetical protein